MRCGKRKRGGERREGWGMGTCIRDRGGTNELKGEGRMSDVMIISKGERKKD